LVLVALEQAIRVLMEVFLFMPQPAVEGQPELQLQQVVDGVALFRPQQVMQAVLAEALPVHPQVEFLAVPGLLVKGITAGQLPLYRCQEALVAAVLLL
jgi:hypothetical protein